MAGPLLLPVKLLGWAAVGAALAAGWKLGSYIVDRVLADEKMCSFLDRMKEKEATEAEPLWKRKFSKVSQD